MREKIYRFGIYIFYLSVFLMPIRVRFFTPLVIISALMILIGKGFRIQMSYFPFAGLFLAFSSVAYYMLHVIGMLWTENVKSGIFDLQVKLSFIAFPVFFLLWAPDEKHITNALRLFVAGCLIMSVFYIAYGFFLMREMGYYPGYVDLFRWHHPSYLSIYFVFSIVAIMYIKLPLLISIPVLVIIFCGLVISSSRLGWLLAFIVPHLIILFSIGKLVPRVLAFALLWGIIIVSYFGVKKFLPGTHDRIFNKVYETLRGNPEPESSEWKRIQAWEVSLFLIKEAWMAGYGTGDDKDNLIAEYEKRGLESMAAHRLNAHSQFLQEGLKLGIPGIFSLLIFIFSGLAQKNNICRYLSIMIFISSCIESIFEGEAGSVFAGFWFSALSLYTTRRS